MRGGRRARYVLYDMKAMEKRGATRAKEGSESVIIIAGERISADGDVQGDAIIVIVLVIGGEIGQVGFTIVKEVHAFDEVIFRNDPAAFAGMPGAVNQVVVRLAERSDFTDVFIDHGVSGLIAARVHVDAAVFGFGIVGRGFGIEVEWSIGFGIDEVAVVDDDDEGVGKLCQFFDDGGAPGCCVDEDEGVVADVGVGGSKSVVHSEDLELPSTRIDQLAIGRQLPIESEGEMFHRGVEVLAFMTPARPELFLLVFLFLVNLIDVVEYAVISNADPHFVLNLREADDPLKIVALRIPEKFTGQGIDIVRRGRHHTFPILLIPRPLQIRQGPGSVDEVEEELRCIRIQDHRHTRCFLAKNLWQRPSQSG